MIDAEPDRFNTARMKSFPRTILILAILLSGILYCKKKAIGLRVAKEAASANQPLGRAYAIKNAVALQEGPEIRSKVMATVPIGMQVSILASRVPDKKLPDKAFWYKAQYAAPGAPVVEGYISEREEILRQNFLVFEKATEEAVMTTSAVNMRKTPALNGTVIQTVKNGEVLKITEMSTSGMEIGDKYGYWYVAADDKGVSGYVFGGYLVPGKYADLMQLKESGFKPTSGWVRITAAEVKPYASPQGKDLFNLADAANGGASAFKLESGVIPKGAILRVDGEVSGKGVAEPRYRVWLRQQAEAFFDAHSFYIPASKVNFTRDYYTWSKTSENTMDAALATAINRRVGGDLNLQCTKVASFTTGTDGEARKFLGITVQTGPGFKSPYEESGNEMCWGTMQTVMVLAEEKEGNFTFYGQTKSDSTRFEDLDNDGIPELVSEESNRGGRSVEIFGLRGNRLTSLISWRGDRGDMSCHNFELKDKQITIDYYEYIKEEIAKGSLPQECKYSAAKFSEEFPGLPLKTGSKPFPYFAKLENGKFVQFEPH